MSIVASRPSSVQSECPRGIYPSPPITFASDPPSAGDRAWWSYCNTTHHDLDSRLEYTDGDCFLDYGDASAWWLEVDSDPDHAEVATIEDYMRRRRERVVTDDDMPWYRGGVERGWVQEP